MHQKYVESKNSKTWQTNISTVVTTPLIGTQEICKEQ